MGKSLKVKRRYFTKAQKISILNELNISGVSLSELSRKYQISSVVLYKWRKKMDREITASIPSPQSLFFKIVNSILFFSVFFSLISHCIFLRGIESDGIEVFAEIIVKNNFFFAEKARLFFHFLYELPFVLYLKTFPSSSLYLMKVVWSFSLIWMHIFSLSCSYWILPKNKKHFIFFPLMGFVLGPMTSLGISISVLLIVCSYIWTLSFIIHYSNLSIKWHKFIFILSICTSFLSYEIMSYMSWFLIFFCLSKLRKNKENQFLVYTGMILLSINSLTSTFFILFFILFPEWTKHRSYFIESLIHFHYFFNPESQLYTPTISASLILLFFTQFYFLNKKIKSRKK